MVDLTRRDVLGGIAGGVLLAAGTESAAATTHARSATTARLRVLHASPDAPDVDVRVRRHGGDGPGQTVVMHSALFFGAVGAYRSLPAGAHRVSLVEAGEPGS